MASTPAPLTMAGVSKYGSPISRWITSLACASSARERTRTSNAVFVPRRCIRLASLISPPSTSASLARLRSEPQAQPYWDASIMEEPVVIAAGQPGGRKGEHEGESLLGPQLGVPHGARYRAISLAAARG